jgi:opacity protein-like surface antigen
VNQKILLFLLAGAAALAQSPFGFGLKAGVPLSDALSTPSGGVVNYFEDTHRFTIGPYAEFRLPSGFSVELDALYRSYDYGQVGNSRFVAPQSVSASVWEFPLLAKKSLFGGPIRPYIEGGVALSHLSVNDVLELNHRNNYGIVLGAGVSLHVGPIRVAPEIRYNGWAFQDFSSPFGGLHSNRNQATVLVGIGF